MAQPIPIEFPDCNAREELIARLRNAPVKHAEAVLSAYEVLQGLHDRGVLDLLRGALGSSDRVIQIAVDAANSPTAIRGLRNVIILAQVLGTIEPKLLASAAESLPGSLAQAVEQKPLNLWQLLKRICNRDSRRVLSAMVRAMESLGKSLGSVATTEKSHEERDQ